MISQLLATFNDLKAHIVFATYKANRTHRFHNHLIALGAVWIYEILMLFSKTPYVAKLQGADLWYEFIWKLPFHSSLPITLLLTFLLGRHIKMDYDGVKDDADKAKDKADIEKSKSPNVTGTIVDGKVQVMMVPPPTIFQPSPKTPLRAQPWVIGRMVWESMLYGSLLWVFLPILTGIITGNWEHPILSSTPLPTPPQLIDYQSNVFQNIALSLGSGFYEELIFRYGLLKYLNKFWLKFFPPREKALWLFEIPKANRAFISHLVAVVSCGFLYALSHLMIPTIHPFAENFVLYNFIYRWMFAIFMSYIMIHRKFGIAVLSHGFYEIFYFAFLG